MREVVVRRNPIIPKVRPIGSSLITDEERVCFAKDCLIVAEEVECASKPGGRGEEGVEVAAETDVTADAVQRRFAVYSRVRPGGLGLSTKYGSDDVALE